jgi:hypothetical protein
MLDTDPALLGIIVTPVLAAVFAFHYYRPMLDTDSALFGIIVTPVLAAVFKSGNACLCRRFPILSHFNKASTVSLGRF